MRGGAALEQVRVAEGLGVEPFRLVVVRAYRDGCIIGLEVGEEGDLEKNGRERKRCATGRPNVLEIYAIWHLFCPVHFIP
jgi:hypothetical protein